MKTRETMQEKQRHKTTLFLRAGKDTPTLPSLKKLEREKGGGGLVKEEK